MVKNNFPKIILVNPQLPENIGLCARAMMNCGFNDLRIINPRESWPNKKAIRSSAHGQDIINDAKIFKDFKSATMDLDFLIATSVRRRFINKNHFFNFKELFKKFNSYSKTGIVFGPERSGLINDEISKCNCIFSLPVHNKSSSLNLSHSVLIMCYEFNKFLYSASYKSDNTNSKVATKKEFYLLMDHLRDNLEDSGFLYPKEKANNMFLNIQNMFIRANFSPKEIRTFRGILRRLRSPKKI